MHAIVPEEPSADGYGVGMIEALRQAGCTVRLHRLPGRARDIDRNAVLAGDVAMARLPDRAAVFVDGDVLANLATAIALDARRLHLTVLLGRAGLPDLPPDLLPEQEAVRRRLELETLALVRHIAVPRETVASALRSAGIDADRVVVATADADGAGHLLSLLLPVDSRSADTLYNA